MSEDTFDGTAVLAAYIIRVQSRVVAKPLAQTERREDMVAVAQMLSAVNIVYHGEAGVEQTYATLGSCFHHDGRGTLTGFLPGTSRSFYAIPDCHHHLLFPLFSSTVTSDGEIVIESRLRKTKATVKTRSELMDWIFDFYADLGYGPKCEGTADA